MGLTELEAARKGEITPAMRKAAEADGVSPEFVREGVARGTIVLIKAPQSGRAVAVGEGVRTKVNASIGTSSDLCDLELEKRKARLAEEAGADTLMELSAAGDIDHIRREIIASVSLPVGNVPLYQAFCDTIRKYGDPTKLDPEYLFDLIERQCADGIAFMAIHCGINLFTLERLKAQGYRYGGLVSKGGALMAQWMVKNRKENPLYEQFDRLLGILKKYDTVLSLGNGMRAGAIHDSLDRAQVAELLINCELAEKAREAGCQVMVEGPGHVPLDEIETSVRLAKKMSGGAPHYMLGPLPCDVGASQDHITAAVGAALSAWYGADLICYVTPAEHLSLPNEEDVVIGVRAARLAAHIGDVVKLRGRADLRDREVSKARRELKWAEQLKHLLFPEEAKRIIEERRSVKERRCSMCGELCALENAEVVFRAFLKGEKV
ncbi:phosphomethylpyrimidine synthase ThiC [Thermosulfurimonas dismutans]|uniref:Phosphomethylpyrimidine synthase n=1 Tax=Thermosulfurimonas dismutans TaxID=999894 RepID=A0A179D2C8_9BACT|nr:phosphomethylpyrimidine synthase ThiC [Thermosulfurimonas dismutans]OAQ20210.1 Thiamin biosynthesis protein ThiC [Thermosulfurimonas dismutans]